MPSVKSFGKKKVIVGGSAAIALLTGAAVMYRDKEVETIQAPVSELALPL